ncbi:hypothetical protein [Natronorubrum thiooxidans]|uniref:Uncharacterized protein n=1 Tax=Natronorubrum thiooxidans TaxID=308853 RepID=A0A1N7EFE7_9EURY|nr:hypothetical protein [Natronorubrum thiooxidans]SIR86774.1 hypothetical protein SAMN05421752_10443 [Natronorubrum thiooxidans]
MDGESALTRPLGVLAVVLLTVLYSLERVVASLSAPSFAFYTGIAGLAVSYLLWRGALMGWIAAVVLYTVSLLNLALGATVFGLSHVPLVAVPLVVLAYLLVARTRFYTLSRRNTTA